MTKADITMAPESTVNPPEYDPVAVRTRPIMDDPKAPPRFPIALMKPMLPAAAASDNRRGGSAQNDGW